MDLKAKFRLLSAVAAFGLLTLSGFWLFSERTSLLAEKQKQARNLVAVPYSIIVQQYGLEEEGNISRREAQKRALDTIAALRYDGDGYYWISDMHPVMVMHPMRPELNGQDLTNYKDSSGKAMFVEMARTVTKDGQGFVGYQWPKPGTKKPVAKLSFVRGFEPWGWVIGTGIYIDDVDTAWRRNAVSAAALGLACLATLLIASVGISRSIFRRLAKVVGRMRDIASAKGDFSRGIEVLSDNCGNRPNDEISVLVAGFNEMLLQIQKRDEQLRRHSEELEDLVTARTAQLQTMNSELATAHAEIELFLECIPSILIGLAPSGHITLWNLTAAQTFGIDRQDAIGRALDDCGIKWLHAEMHKEIAGWLGTESTARCDDLAFEKERSVHFVGFSVRPIFSKQKVRIGLIITGADVTERKCLEEQLRQANKLQAIGQLAAGIAHEINTPTQYVADNTTFLQDSCKPLMELLKLCTAIRREAETAPASTTLLARFDQLVEEADLPYLEKEIPKSIEQSLEGLRRIARIVKAMKEFSHPGSSEKVAIDINRAIQTTITVARNEWKYVAELDTDLEDGLPPVPCLQGEFQQVILNLIVNAAQAIAGVAGDGSREKGRITLSTRRKDKSVEITIRDTGPGIPPGIRSRIFEPFFTTKAVGKGTGQGLSLAHSAIVNRHQGRIWFETEVGEGTTFFLELPLQTSQAASASR